MNASVQATAKPRLDYIDNLRWTMIFLVVLQHAAVTYSGLGSWYHVEKTELASGTALLFMFWQSHAQAFFMGLLFFLAGLFVPAAYERKGPTRFLRDRFIRLGLPTLVYMLVVHPLLIGWFELHWWKNWGDFGQWYWRQGLLHLKFLDCSGPMWFAFALLIFNVVYVLYRRIAPPPKEGATCSAGWASILFAGALIWALAFAIRLVQPIGASVMNMQLCYFAQYVVLFPLGVAAARRGWLDKLTDRTGAQSLMVACLIGPLLWILMGATTGAMHNDYTSILGGWHWQSAFYAFWESFFCVTFSAGLLTLYRSLYNRRGRLEGFLTDNSFAVYFIHPPVLIGVTLLMTAQPWPALVKCLVAAMAAIAASYALSSLALRRTPGLRRIL